MHKKKNQKKKNTFHDSFTESLQRKLSKSKVEQITNETMIM